MRTFFVEVPYRDKRIKMGHRVELIRIEEREIHLYEGEMVDLHQVAKLAARHVSKPALDLPVRIWVAHDDKPETVTLGEHE